MQCPFKYLFLLKGQTDCKPIFGESIQYGVQGSYEPRWYMQNDQLINRSMWSAALVLGMVRVGYEQWYMPDDSIMSSWKIMFGPTISGSSL